MTFGTISDCSGDYPYEVEGRLEADVTVPLSQYLLNKENVGDR